MSTAINILQDNITKIVADAIVNAANQTLLGGGGVDGAIHFMAGPELKEECRALNGCKKGEAKITKGHNLPAKFIIHTVGPVFGYENGKEEIILRNCYNNSLRLAKTHGLRTIAFPAISTGCYRFPKDRAAKIAIKCANNFIKEFPDSLDEIIFVLFSEFDYLIYKKTYEPRNTKNRNS